VVWVGMVMRSGRMMLGGSGVVLAS
jgi:hypothetical protein